MSALILYFADEREAALRLAAAAGLSCAEIERHRFPDDELRLRLPLTDAGALAETLVLYRSLDRPNEKLVELLLVAGEARRLGARRLLLAAPYLAYMRQDIAFHPGEVVSQKVVGAFLAGLFDGVLTVDPHLHRIAPLSEAIPHGAAVSLSGAPLLAALVAGKLADPLLIGPDAESRQWIEAAAAPYGFDFRVCRKERRSDRDVAIFLPQVAVAGRAVVLLDDVASSGHTLAEAARLLLAAGPASVDVAVTHALFAGDALDLLRGAGVREVWSSDCIPHPSNAVSVAPLLAGALAELGVGAG